MRFGFSTNWRYYNNLKRSSSLLRISSLFLLFTVIALSASSQNSKFNLEGFLYEQISKTPIEGATITINNLQSVRSKRDGHFSFLLPAGNYRLRITHLSYEILLQDIEIQKDQNLTFFLNSKSSLMTEVKVSGSRIENRVQQLAPNAETLTKKDLEKVPAFMGQRDALKALQTLPGTGKSGEGNSGFYVRGGTAGQNLTLFNDAVIYNPSHLLGFFSVFNSAAVDQVKLYKSGIPAEYGGRLSSIIEINSSKEITDSLSAILDVSILSTTAKLDVPITSNWSVTASTRKTLMKYTIWPLINQFTPATSTFNKMKYDFSDLNLNSNARIGKNNYIYFSAYTGGDDFGFTLSRININNTMNWKNTAYSLTWKKILRNFMVLNTTASYSAYKFNFGMKQDEYQAGISSKIKDYNFKTSLNIYLDNHTLKTGIQYTDHNYTPNTPFLNSIGTNYDFGVSNIYYSDESSAFVSDEYKLSDQTGIYTGARLSYYRHKGPYHFINEDKSEQNYRSNSVVSSFVYFEPSITFHHSITANSSIKISYSRNVQPVHLISITAVNFPADFWMPSLRSLSPEKGYQASAGYYKNFGKRYESYVDFYYKKMNGLVEFSGGIMNLIDNLKIEENLLYGSGNAYGSEFFIKKKTGKLTGWIGYTLSKSNRNFKLINNAEDYPAKYDRRHDLSIISNYSFSKKWVVSGSFTYATGNAYTKPTSRYLIGGNVVNEYGAFNGNRMPSYHRMDLAATYTMKPHLHTTGELSFSIYNVYNKQNPIYIYFLAEGDLEKKRISIQPKSIALLPVLPSINYRITFR